jgi:hypothetical protein
VHFEGACHLDVGSLHPFIKSLIKLLYVRVQFIKYNFVIIKGLLHLLFNTLPARFEFLEPNFIFGFLHQLRCLSGNDFLYQASVRFLVNWVCLARWFWSFSIGESTSELIFFFSLEICTRHAFSFFHLFFSKVELFLKGLLKLSNGSLVVFNLNILAALIILKLHSWFVWILRSLIHIFKQTLLNALLNAFLIFNSYFGEFHTFISLYFKFK